MTKRNYLVIDLGALDGDKLTLTGTQRILVGKRSTIQSFAA
jgi:hypothetical protein